MSTTKAITANAERKYGGMCIFYAGNKASNSPVTSAPGLTSAGYHSGMSGSIIAGPETDATIAAGTDTKGTFKPYSSGTFKYYNHTRFIGKRMTSYISGVANTTLLFAASDKYRTSINKLESRRTIRATAWNMLTGQPTKTVALDSFGADHAATPTRAVPGEFVYLATGTTPTQADYAARTG